MYKEKIYKIQKLRSRLKFKELILTDDRILKIPYSTCIDKNNRVVEANSNLYIECKNGRTKIFPTYCIKDRLQAGGYSIDLLIKEITDEQEFRSYQSLSEFHYKSKELFGRTSILIAVNTSPYLPKVIGYIEIATPFYVNKPRSKVLNTPFDHNGIKWESWDKETTKKYINVIARIARCVVYPEFRGVGLGKKLIEHAELFAKERWQIDEYKPLFLEISADMLRYVPFAKAAGMHYIGETQGNLNRISSDLAYLLKNYNRVKSNEIVGKHQIGIVEQQKSRLRKAIHLAEVNNMSIDQFIDRLKKLEKDKRLVDFTFFNGLVSLPKPTYIKGLDKASERYLTDQIDNDFPNKADFHEILKPDKISTGIKLKDLTITYSSRIRRTQKTQAIQNAFGIAPNQIETPIIKDLTITIEPGSILLIIGSSGSGKTTLLDLFNKKLKSNIQANISGQFNFPLNYNPGAFSEIKSQKALIEYFGNEDIEYSMQLLSSVGLSDAFVFVKRFHELSNGQKYRALFARLLHAKHNVLIVDEFCANLDPITANVLSYKINKLVKRLGITLIVGASHCDTFVRSLNPDKVLRLSSAWDHEIIDGNSFTKRYKLRYEKIKLRPIFFKPDYFALILAGKKSTTIRKYNPAYKLGFSIFESEGQLLPVYIKNIQIKSFDELTIQDSLNDGFKSLQELHNTLLRIYGKLNQCQKMSILHFQTLDFQ